MTPELLPSLSFEKSLQIDPAALQREGRCRPVGMQQAGNQRKSQGGPSASTAYFMTSHHQAFAWTFHSSPVSTLLSNLSSNTPQMLSGFFSTPVANVSLLGAIVALYHIFSWDAF